MNKLIRHLPGIVGIFFLALLPLSLYAQDSESEANTTTEAVPKNDKKIIRDATISLQTTVTGNQEQPRVMYILPWQSPLSDDLDIEMLDSQQEAVFGHVEREELQRGLEAAGEFDQDDK